MEIGNQWPLIVLHNVNASSKCTEFVRIGSAFGFRTLIITQAQGSAAQNGIPSAQKLALKNKLNFLALYSVEDVIELFNPEQVVLIAPPPFGKENLSQGVIDEIKAQKTVVVFGGNDPGLSRKDLDLGRTVQLSVGDIGSIATLSLTLALLKHGNNLLPE